jgi:hypothetical protein
MSIFEIKNRFTGVVLYAANLENDTDNLSYSANLGRAVVQACLSRASLSGAKLSRAKLSGANLSGADLFRANLCGADLSGADLSGANLCGANLSGANLSDANLCSANLCGADLSDAKLSDVPIVAALDTKILAAIEGGCGFDMSDWHTCETTHCRAGWAIVVAGREGKELESRLGPSAAGALIYAAAYPDLPVPDFYAKKEDALADIRIRAARDV